MTAKDLMLSLCRAKNLNKPIYISNLEDDDTSAEIQSIVQKPNCFLLSITNDSIYLNKAKFGLLEWKEHLLNEVIIKINTIQHDTSLNQDQLREKLNDILTSFDEPPSGLNDAQIISSTLTQT